MFDSLQQFGEGFEELDDDFLGSVMNNKQAITKKDKKEMEALKKEETIDEVMKDYEKNEEDKPDLIPKDEFSSILDNHIQNMDTDASKEKKTLTSKRNKKEQKEKI